MQLSVNKVCLRN